MKLATQRRRAVAFELFALFYRKAYKKAMFTPAEAWAAMKPVAKVRWYEQADIAINAYESTQEK